jgi:hypothetical protein
VFWKTVKYLTKQKTSIPVLKDADGRTITDDAEKATLLNDYFTKIMLQYRSSRTERKFVVPTIYLDLPGAQVQFCIRRVTASLA